MSHQSKFTKVLELPNEDFPKEAAKIIYGKWLIMEDNWITRSDKLLRNERTGQDHKLLDYDEVEVWINPKHEKPEWLKGTWEYPISRAYKVKRALIQVENQQDIIPGDRLEVIFVLPTLHGPENN